MNLHFFSHIQFIEFIALANQKRQQETGAKFCQQSDVTSQKHTKNDLIVAKQKTKKKNIQQIKVIEALNDGPFQCNTIKYNNKRN